MSIKLTAEQRTIFEVFSGKVRYIIPPYQRSYTWNIQHCTELWDDLITTYNKNKDDGYFLGNIVLAKSTENRDALEVIDGQQRLITLTLLIHALLQFDTDNIDLKDAITIRPSRGNDKGTQRLTTNIFIDSDVKCLRDALALTPSDYTTHAKHETNLFIENAKYFYQKIKDLEKKDIQDFVDFLLKDVWLLPIQAEDRGANKARDSALNIFETINNRGLSLSDSDIFKAKLYSKALNELKHEDFIQKWKTLDEDCQSLQNKNIDDIFRAYTHIIRGEENIKSNEIGLREFFAKESSPFNRISYEIILDDLFKIVEAMKFFENVIRTPSEYPNLSKWFQLVDEHTNRYPFHTLLVFLYKHGLQSNDQLIQFCQNLIRYSYYNRTTSQIKFHLFDVMASIFNKDHYQYEYYPDSVDENDFKYFGTLKRAFSLLALYLNDQQNAIFPYYFNKLILANNKSSLNNTWDQKEYTDYTDTIGNMIVIDKNISRYIAFDKKADFLKKTGILEAQDLSGKITHWSYQDYDQRERLLHLRLLKFFTKPTHLLSL